METLPETTFLNQTCFNDRVEIFKLSNISLVKDYIPHPDSIIKNKFQDLSNKMKKELEDLTKPDYPPFSTQAYGKIRRQVYSDLEKFTKDFSPVKKNECKYRFYKEVDLNFQPLFQDSFDIRQSYLELLVSKEFDVVEDHQKKFLDLEESQSRTPAELLKLDILNLTLDWLALIDNIVDILVRCQLYDIRGETIFQDFHSKVQKKFSKTQTVSWPQKIFNDLQFSIGYFKNLIEARQFIDLTICTEVITPTDLFTMILRVTYGDIVLKYLKYMRLSDHEGFLVTLKGFLLLLVQTLTHNVKDLHLQFEKRMLVTSKKEQEKEEQGLYELFDQLLCFRDNLTFFDEEFTKGTFVNFITL